MWMRFVFVVRGVGRMVGRVVGLKEAEGKKKEKKKIVALAVAAETKKHGLL